MTGLSPMTGPPGAKITIRGENFGHSSDDVINLTINGADCLPYLEWKSSKKIITRCTKTLGYGDVIITTNSGGIGTCDVQFNCYEEKVGLTDESAVWIDEADDQANEKEKLVVINTGDEHSLEVSSTRFQSHLYLSHTQANASLDDLEHVRNHLRTELAMKSDPDVVSSSSNRAALLKSNLPVIMECLHILENLNKVVITSRDSSIDNAVKLIKESLTKTHELFDPLLAQKDLVKSVESAMQVFRQNETLFNLPSAIETSIKARNYDSVVNEISVVLSRLKTIDIDPNLTGKIQTDLTSKVNKLKLTIETQLQQSCRSTTADRNIEEVRKLISHLNKLGEPVGFNLWIAMTGLYESLVETMSDKYRHYLKFERSKSDSSKTSSRRRSSSQKRDPPSAVKFVDFAIGIFNNTYYDLLSLGQCYFDSRDELACKDEEDVMQAKLIEFEELMVANSIQHLSFLLRSALIQDSAKLEKPSEWPDDSAELSADWLEHILQSVISCHINLTKVNVSSKARAAVDDFKELVFELRLRSMQVLFGNATRFNKSLHQFEDWSIDVDDLHGGRTKLPAVFENNVIETLKFANETIFKPSLAEEKSILKRVDVQAVMKELATGLINSFLDSLESALIDTKEHQTETTRILMASRDSKRIPSEYMNRLLITISNCQFTKDRVFPRLQSEFEKFRGLKMDRVFKVCNEQYCNYVFKTSEKFCRIKCAELNKTFSDPNSKSKEDLQVNLMIVNSQIYLVAPQLVNSLMTSIVSSMQRKASPLSRK